MDLHRYTSRQLDAMHKQAAADCHDAITLAEFQGDTMRDLATSPNPAAYYAAAANFRILFLKARELQRASRELYNEICRRAGIDGEQAIYDAMTEARNA